MTEVKAKAPTDKQRIERLEKELIALKAAFSKVTVLTGHGNHLNEYGIEKWVPTKKDMNKKYK